MADSNLIDKAKLYHRAYRSRGFTLVELAIVLVIISALMATTLVGLSGFVDSGKTKATQTYLQEARTALLNYAAVNGFLLCPDTDDDGMEDRGDTNGGECEADNGGLPYSDLGLERLTPWDRVAFYAIDTDVDTTACTDGGQKSCFFESTNVLAFNRTTPPVSSDGNNFSLQVNDRDGNLAGRHILAVIGSYGKNSAITESNCNSAASNDEKENCDGDAVFVMDTPTETFDDQLIWIDANAVKGQALDAGWDLSN
ncbi:type II secretion system protein [Marinobacterium arenosum]|uniref:type II secretion system protein n=1 Tax=Marinobacterium arenosum TaxID=2862496 RepID=UPI001C981A64|nr:type II secretion system protein [Marinobacterium arenosum]MBY4676523.1 type II secretion system GspH family protein [Marinobacterium arenosum]